MASFKQLQDEFNEMVGRLQEFSGLGKELVQNVVVYAKSLPVAGTDIIDEPVFTAQMSRTFKISSSYMIARMYSITKAPKSVTATVEEYCRTVCTFLTPHVDRQVDFVFKVYDANLDGEISQLELMQLLRPCIISTDEDVDLNDALRDLIELVMTAVDTGPNRTGAIDLEEFRSLVKKDVLMLQCLGPCLPLEHNLVAFRKTIEGKTMDDITEMFKNERRLSLNEVKLKAPMGLYPIKLDIP